MSESSKLHVVHINTERTWRGGEQQVFSLVKGLAARGHRNTVVVRRNSALAEKMKALNVETIPVSPIGEWNFIEAHFLNRWIKKNKPALLHAHTAHAVALAALATLGTSVPFVLTRRVDFHLSSNPFSKWKYGRAAKVIAISEAVKKILIEDGIPSERIVVVPSGIDVERVANVKPVPRREIGVPEEFFLIGQVAALADHKDQPTFLRAMVEIRKEFPTARAVIVGDGPLRASHERLHRKLGLGNAVQFLGFKENSLSYLAAFDVFCLSSKEEGLGTSLIDAMALRVPVVATTAGGIREIVTEPAEGLLVPPQNPMLLAQALAAVIRDKAAAKARAEAAYKKSQRFNVVHTISGTESVYNQVINSA